jgi:hypothetical protein
MSFGALLGNLTVERLFIRAPLSANNCTWLSVDAVEGLLLNTAFYAQSDDILLDCLL